MMCKENSYLVNNFKLLLKHNKQMQYKSIDSILVKTKQNKKPTNQTKKIS